MAIPNFESIGDAVAFNNVKLFGDAGAHMALQAAQQYGAHNSRMNTLAESVYGEIANKLVATDPVQAASIKTVLTGRESNGIAEAISLAHILTKSAQTTPPVTAYVPVQPPGVFPTP